MKNKKNRIHAILINISLIFLMVGFISCDGFQEQIVSVDVPVENVSSVLVINAEIEKEETAWVQISYSESINAPAGTPVNYEENARVTLETSSGNSEPLSYTGNGMYEGSSIAGMVGETYTITIDINGQIYSANSTMLPEPGYQGAWVTSLSDNGKDGKGSSYGGYDEEWIVNDPSNERNRYLFEWYTNGRHDVGRDWAIDDNRVVNVNEGLRLINPTRGINANEYTVFRAAEIDKITYDYYNMYEKIVRGIVGADAQTPFNPVSNFGEGTMGNFRAVAFSSIAILTPPNISVTGQNEQNVISFPLNDFFVKYHLYLDTSPGLTPNSPMIREIINNDSKNGGGGKGDDGGKGSAGSGESGIYAHTNLVNNTMYYYRLEVEDAEGTVSVLSPEVGAAPDPNVPADGDPGDKPTGSVPTNVTAVPGANPGEIVISWDPADGAQQYGIYWSNQPGITGEGKENAIWGGDKSGGVVESPFTHTGLDNSLTYYYRVASYDGSAIHLSEEVNAQPN
ncbi:DUF4249 family protein [candidate division KSB1 bacterium]|nr:DUF4249 family protein [candidate division KSB1 bacterium]